MWWLCFYGFSVFCFLAYVVLFLSCFSLDLVCAMCGGTKKMSGCGDVVLWEGSWRGWVENCGGSCWGWLMVTPRSIGLLGSGLTSWRRGYLEKKRKEYLGGAMGVSWPGDGGLPYWAYMYFVAKRLEAKRTSRKWIVSEFFDCWFLWNSRIIVLVLCGVLVVFFVFYNVLMAGPPGFEPGTCGFLRVFCCSRFFGLEGRRAS